MALFANKLTSFFCKKKSSYVGVGKDSLSTKDLKSMKINKEYKNEIEKDGRSNVNIIKFFKCGKPTIIATNCFSKQKCMNKYAMKVKVTILNSTSNDDEDDTNLLAFMASRTFVDPLTTISDVQEVIVEDDEYELVESYNDLF